jgi:hypothetical protein
MPARNATRDEIAHILKITPRQVNLHVKNDGMPSLARGEYDLIAVVQWYVDRLRKEVQAVRQGDETQQISTSRILRAKAESAEDKLKKQRGELIPLSQLLPAMERVIGAFKSARTGMGAKLAPQLTGRSQSEIKTIIDTEVYDQLTELSQASVTVLDLCQLGGAHRRAASPGETPAEGLPQPVGRRKKVHLARQQPHRVRPVAHK